MRTKTTSKWMTLWGNCSLWLSLAGCVALLAAGCSSPSSTTTTSTTDALGSDATATTDANAGDDGQGGDIAAVVCAAPNVMHECDTNDECASGQYCDPCLKTCQKTRAVCDPCTTDAQCGDESNKAICIPYAKGGNFCGKECLGNAGCDKGYSCKKLDGVASMQCVPNSGSCAPGSGACKIDADCPFQFICNPDYGACVKGCLEDLTCPQSTESPLVCSLGHCVAPCTKDADCTPISAEAKCVESHCKIPGGCLSSLECQPEQHCSLATHKCVAGCTVDADCQDASQTCGNDGKCVHKGCTMNYECAFGEVCDAATGQCQDPGGLYCAACDDQDQDVKACGGKPALCSKVKDNTGAEFGPFCFIPCSESATGPCPQGYGCQEVKDDKGAVQGKVCFRQCQHVPQQSTP